MQAVSLTVRTGVTRPIRKKERVLQEGFSGRDE